jgi:hypothetical protein
MKKSNGIFQNCGMFFAVYMNIIMDKTPEFQEQTRGKQNRLIIGTEARDY